MADVYDNSGYGASAGWKAYFGDEPYADIFNYSGVGRDPNALPLTSDNPNIQALINSGTISRSDRSGINEGGEFRTIQDTVNWGDPSLPKMGPASTAGKFNWIPASPEGTNLINSSLLYHDPNYGWLTPAFNSRSNLGDWQDYIGPLVMAAVTMGAGALAGAGVGAAGAGLAGTEAGLSAAEMGAGAGAAGAGYSGAAAGLYSSPWYLSAGQSVARQLGSENPTAMGIGEALIPGASEFGIPSYLTTAASALGSYLKPEAKAQPAFNTMNTYDPSAFGKMDNAVNLGGVSDGSQRVATAVAPDAYGNSYNQVTT